MKARRFLFIGGPLHSQWLDVEQAETPDVGAHAAVDSDTDDAFPDVVVKLEFAANYLKRSVAHVAADTKITYAVTVYLWEGCQDQQQATTLLGDAVAHRWFIEHGRASNPAARPAAPSRIIVPGR